MGVLVLAVLTSLAAAPPAEARPGPCRGSVPAVGATVEGVVLHVEDGRRLCLATGPTPERWTEVVLAPAATGSASTRSPQMAKAALMSVAFTRRVSCVVGAGASGPPIAHCSIDGVPVADLLAAPSVEGAAIEWIPRRDPAAGAILAGDP